MVLHGRTDAQGGALVPPPVQSVHFIWAVGSHMRHEPGGHIAPLVGAVHGGGGRVPCPMTMPWCVFPPRGGGAKKKVPIVCGPPVRAAPL